MLCSLMVKLCNATVFHFLWYLWIPTSCCSAAYGELWYICDELHSMVRHFRVNCTRSRPVRLYKMKQTHVCTRWGSFVKDIANVSPSFFWCDSFWCQWKFKSRSLFNHDSRTHHTVWRRCYVECNLLRVVVLLSNFIMEGGIRKSLGESSLSLSPFLSQLWALIWRVIPETTSC